VKTPSQIARYKAEALFMVKDQQMKWAGENRIEMERPDYTMKVDGNLFANLSEQCVKDLTRGQGGELTRRSDETPPKFQALHSSAALVANVFDYWRSRDLSILAAALASPHRLIRMEVEAPFHTGFGFPANLDVVLASKADAWLLAIESKFLEPFSKHDPGLKIGYVPEEGDSAWKKIGLTKCDFLARDIQAHPDRFEYLNCPQNLKHILALHKTVSDRFRLLYLFYDVEGLAGDAHRSEAEDFKTAVEREIDFEWMTYQTLVERLKKLSADPADDAYFAYLKTRYRLPS
jgi:hypothetical protein